ncbi:MAG: radical SAM protein [Methanoregula sp.]|uniref:B12-binding domain-containing radical SAM protein n=1 Tax=Methanoregula sp. TaxID=2052170 RepID=UPI003C24869B
MNVLLINVPSRRDTHGGTMPPLGLLYAGSIFERLGHRAKIYDPYLSNTNFEIFDAGDYSELDSIIRDFHPDIVGFGGIASSYGRTKKLSAFIKKKYPGVFQIAGGPLASVYELLLTKTKVDLVFHGETERTLPIFLERFSTKSSFSDIPGVSTITQGRITRNPLAPQIENLDDIPIPAYHLIDIKAYNPDKVDVLSSRGCTNKCSFCYRHMKGHRQHSIPYLINHIKFLINTYGYRKFDISDELFNANRQWVLNFCDALERQNLQISFKTSMRADKVDVPMLKRLKSTGCVQINYGHESGSEVILKEYRKGVDAKTNTAVTIMTRECGIDCPVQVVIGSPSETPETIRETTDFLIAVGGADPSINYLIPFPETPVWEHVKKHNLIPDVEKFLDDIARWGGSPVVNLTAIPDNVWRTWSYRIKADIKLASLKKEGKILHYTGMRIIFRVIELGYIYAPRAVIQMVRNRRTYG